jgi:predicted nucleotidyltransferase
MKSTPKKYPAIWLKNRMNKQSEREQRRLHTVHEVDRALKKLMKSYAWDEAYMFGSLAKTGQYRPGSDVDIALSGLNKFDYYAFVGDISEMLNKRVDVVLLEECRFRKAIMEKGIKWSPKKK